MIGKIERVPLRTIWPHEEHDFSKWLFDNLDYLNEILEFEIIPIEKEKFAGSFRVDILAEDTNGKSIIIENQLEKSDHNHLGKVITYLSNFDASAAIWIVSDPRPEHINAITWLNEASSGEFYLIKLEALKIGNSDPAPLFQ